MQLNGARILLTGASGGLGGVLARELAQAGAALLLTGRDPVALARIDLPAGSDYRLLQADLTDAAGIDSAVAAARAFGTNILINNAGVASFGLLAEQDWNDIERILATNLGAPIRLTRALLPWLTQQPTAAVVNIGSAFGSIPFAGFTAYSAAKAGLRGFSQALRRELADSTVRVIHVAPRAIDTPINPPAVRALNRALGSATDTPEKVARHILGMLANDVAEGHIGFPERFFAWLNGCAPGLVDQGLRGKLARIKQHAAKA
ncbi:short-subunit dehydrogenase [Azonexus fungiphilus]|uniref:Short-subunit dehydrogenase n=1 Tax=Azonexus fungiphilus TaxID=146940 RepID=A0A495WB27_9RHOO|nr:SDR family oxidoreductase [Azonexus fungiphilus]RKT58579.1 short-subunit dehydrogenase [Azonexus fungiphilus]